MSQLNLKPTHAAVKNYYAALHQLGQLHIDHEMAVRSAFQDLLSSCGRKLKLTLAPEFEIKRKHSSIRVDGALLDAFHLAHGYWEAKDEKDDLDREIKAKLDKGYPRDNIIFQAPNRAVLYQSGARVADLDISNPDNLVQIVNHFFDYKAPHIEEWEQAVAEFSDRIPELSDAVKKIIDEERRRNPAFVRSFDDFYALCRQAINPNLSEDAVERMLIQHLLTERIFERIFDNPDFTRRNVVAVEIEKVIVELTKRAFNRNEFLRPLDRFYKAIEVSAENTTGFTEKQAFLNKVYERFFQGYSTKEADTHGIVYTPQPIVNFMVRSVEEILQKEFGRSLGDKGVHILDPFVGTGNSGYVTTWYDQSGNGHNATHRQLHRQHHGQDQSHRLALQIRKRTPLQRSHAAPLLHRQHEHRARVLGSHRRVPIFPRDLFGGYVRTGGTRASVARIHGCGERGTRETAERIADLCHHR